MASYLTAQQIATLGLSGTPTQVAATLSDALTVYTYLSANAWITDAALTTWAQKEWPPAATAVPPAPTAAQRLQAALSVLEKASLIQQINSSFQPSPTG